VVTSSRAGGRTYLIHEVARTANQLSLLHYKRLAPSLPTETAGHLTEYLYSMMTGDLVSEMCDRHQAVFDVIPLLIVAYCRLRGSNDLRVGRKRATFQLFFQSGQANDLSASL